MKNNCIDFEQDCPPIPAQTKANRTRLRKKSFQNDWMMNVTCLKLSLILLGVL